MLDIITMRSLIAKFFYAGGSIEPYYSSVSSGGGGDVIDRIKPDKDNEIWIILTLNARHNDGTAARSTRFKFTNGTVDSTIYAEVIAATSLGIHLYSATGIPFPLRSDNASHVYVECASMAAAKAVIVEGLYVKLPDVEALLTR